jgi:hypothetical protein
VGYRHKRESFLEVLHGKRFANGKGSSKMRTTYTIDSIKFVENFLVIKVEGKEYFFELERISEKLNAASEMQRNIFKISPSGYGIHWPLLDEDLSISSLFQNL